MDRNEWNNQIIEEFRSHEGKVGGNWEGKPLLLLHTKGARTGEARINPLAYQKLKNGYAIFASKGGAPTNPDWYRNLVANSSVAMEVGTERFDVNARVAKGQEREDIWRLQQELVPGIAAYQKQTARQFPVVILERPAV